MTLIQWRDEFSVGVAAVDHEHRQLIELINTLNDNAQAGHDRDQVVRWLGEIFTQVSAHFALEEKIMRDSAYDGYAEHKRAHEDLLDELRDIMDRVEDDGGYDEARLGNDLDRWFSVHFKTQDARFHANLNR
jgi:hemerythrin